MRKAQNIASLALLAVVLLLASIGVSQGGAANPTPQRACFPAHAWDAPQGERPCARIVRVHEDGSVTVRVADADGTPRYEAGVGALDR